VDLSWSEQEEDFRAEARGWLSRALQQWRDDLDAPVLSGDTAEGFAQHLVWERMLFDARWAVVSWAPEHGGRGASLWEWLIFEEEYYRAGAPPRITQNGIFLLAPSIYEYGTPEQQAGLLPRIAAAEDLWCQGWSEPNAGSDLAAVACRARRVSGGWVLDGQKTWTTRGAFCTHLFGLFRSERDSERHRGLTYLLVPLDAPGVTVRGFGRLDGDEGFAEVFFDEAFLADDAVPGGVMLGEQGGGWAVAMSTAGSERGLTLRSPGRFLATADRLLDEVRAHSAALDPTLRGRAVDAWMRAEAYQLHTLQTVTRLVAGGQAGPEASLAKLWWSELDVELHEVALDLLGGEAELEGPWSKGWQFSLAGPIYAGTNEIQRNIAAERLLGLPRR
jgi:alkylation response protein AidB-like acyl-CoA dehydrogenase